MTEIVIERDGLAVWLAFTSLAVLLVYLLGIYFAMRAAATARTSQGAVGWVVFLLSAPFFAVPLYLFLGQRKYQGYMVSRRESAQIMAGIKEFAIKHAPTPGSTRIAFEPFEYCADLQACRGNGADILIDGDATFGAIFAAIDSAKTYILIQSYIIHDDDLGFELQRHLIDASKRGVMVRLMTDAVGSHKLPESYSDTLRDAGVQVVDKKTAKGPRFRFQLNFRNHRKSIIIDGITGFIGGLNVGDEYMGRSEKFGHWRDTHLQIYGPIVSQLQLVFAEDWHWATNETLMRDVNWQVPHSDQDMTALIVATGPGDASETGSLMFFSAIAEAKQRIWIASPYFIPDLDITTALRHAALRGVDVRILIPDMADHRLSWLAAYSYFDDVTEAGVRIFRYGDGFMHQKVFLVDDELAAIGTTNLDNRSFRLNFEAMALFFDKRAAAEVDTMLRADFKKAYEINETIDQQSAYIRYGAPVARLFSPLL
ncbi:MAG: cardiolipin synthase [Granulosicoccus sp.]|jgi:cardiolipin synthase